jgi:glycosyl transferase family 2
MKTRIVAIAKDEGAYLADWVFHHRYFGFDEVHVCLNRTTDQSATILDKIAFQDSAVTYEHIDWIDYCSGEVARHMQMIAYAKALGKAERAGVDWLMFLDVDEFWMPADFKTRIDSYLDALFTDRALGAVCHLWHNEHGVDSCFSPVSANSKASIAPNVKTIFPVNKVKKVRVHVPRLHSGVPTYDADGLEMAFYEKTQRASVEQLASKGAFVLHRQYRSEIEYLAAILRGNPEQDDYGLKRNRSGYVAAQECKGAEVNDSYRLARERFITVAGLNQILEDEQERVRSRASIAERRLRVMLDQGDDSDARALAKRIVRGLSKFELG